MKFKISVDNGGTFTDGILIDENGDTVIAKSHTTPRDLTEGTMACIERLGESCGLSLGELLEQTSTIVLGTTLATNIVATRSGARTGAITTKGFRDRLAFLHTAKADLGGDRKATSAELFSFRSEYPKPLTRRRLMIDVEERLNYKGDVIAPLNEDQVRQAAKRLKDEGVESIAVMFLFSHLNPNHEQRAAEIIREEFPQAYISLSSDVLPVMGEVARWSTTIFSAYVAPRVIDYVSRIEGLLNDRGFNGALVFMQSNGGVASAGLICENPAALLLSGPASGPSLGLKLAGRHGIDNVITADMGGTSFDVSIIPDGQIGVTQKKVIDGKKYGLATVDVNAIGAGGGSIAWIDTMTGRLDVGPHSAGAYPGPACYGNGGLEPTITDANVVLGYIDPDFFLGGETKLRKDLAEKSIRDKIAAPLGLGVPEAAAAIYDVVNAKMAGAIDVLFSKRGLDPRDFTLCAAGGALPVHVARLVAELGLTHFLVPKVAPVFCAYGMMYADLRHDFTRPFWCQTADADLESINGLFLEMEKEAVEMLRRESVRETDIRIERSMDIHYYGQVREQNAAVPDGAVTAETLAETMTRFHERHGKIIGYSDPKYPTEIVRLHLSGIAPSAPPVLRTIEKGSGSPEKALKGRRPIFLREWNEFREVPIYNGAGLLSGDRIDGPCIVEEKLTTLVVPPHRTIKVDPYGNFTTLREV